MLKAPLQLAKLDQFDITILATSRQTLVALAVWLEGHPYSFAV